MPEVSSRHHNASTARGELLACVTCRSRKLKCDRTKPSCARCRKDGGDCAYPESRRKQPFRREHVKQLEARLAHVERALRKAEASKASGNSGETTDNPSDQPPIQGYDIPLENSLPENDANPEISENGGHAFILPDYASQGPDFAENGELIGLGYSELPPPQEIQDELNKKFFLAQYHSIPIIHSGRYYQSLYAGPLRRPPMSLQNAIWALAASGHTKYDRYAEIFYKRACKYLEADEMKEHDGDITHAQALCLVAAFEARSMLFTRASLHSARAVRLCQIMGLDRVDSMDENLDNPCAELGLSWGEIEERRRIFWGVFAMDSQASISTGWPIMIDHNDIMTRLPSSEQAFVSGKKEEAPFLEDVFEGAQYSGFGGTIVVVHILRMIFQHAHRTKPSHNAHTTDSQFWKRHRDLDDRISKLFMFLPPSFHIPPALRDPRAIYLNLNLQAAVIILHQALLDKYNTPSLPETVRQTSLGRMRASAEEIANIMKLSSHSPFVLVSIKKIPLCALSLYCSTTVYVYLAKNASLHLTSLDKSNHKFIVHAMEAISQHHDLMAVYLQYASLDIEKNNVSSILNVPILKKYRTIFGGLDSPYVPIISRSSISKHTSLMPVLPGRLPLGKPQGRMLPGSLKMDNGDLPVMLRDDIKEREKPANDFDGSSLDEGNGKMRAGANPGFCCDDAGVPPTFVGGSGGNYDFQTELLGATTAASIGCSLAGIPAIPEETSTCFPGGPGYHFAPMDNMTGATYPLGDELEDLQENQANGWTL